jgi:hypothetical protein
MSGVISPLIFTGILAYFTSAMFCEIFGMGIQTILLCFIADEEMFPPEKRFADGSLQSAVARTAQSAAGNTSSKSAKIIPIDSANQLQMDDNRTDNDAPLV